MGRLTPDQRSFFDLVVEAAFANPFEDRRAEIDDQLVPDAANRDAQLEALTARVGGALRDLGAGGSRRLDLRDFDADERRVLELCILFDVFHRHMEPVDAHLHEQLAAPVDAAPIRAAFARGVLDDLLAHGIDGDSALFYLALIFQLRRAFYFIEYDLIGESPSMLALKAALWRNVFTGDIELYGRYLSDRMEDFSTLLLGATGTGKGTAAAAIGRSGLIPYDAGAGRFRESFAAAFVSLNLSQFPAALIESELFGHDKGAFTGAIDHHEGVLERCSPHGAIFLDEIGDVAAPIQIKLLQILQQRTFSRVGSHELRRFRGRVIAATHQSIDAARRSGRFRDDFFYRLSSDVIRVPTLAERIREDDRELPRLVDHAVARIVGEPSPALVGRVLDAIDRDLPPAYGWPGNVRELEQCVRRVLLTGRYTGDRAGAAVLGAALVEQLEAGTLDARELLAHYCAQVYRQVGAYEGVARRIGLDRRTVKKHVARARELGLLDDLDEDDA